MDYLTHADMENPWEKSSSLSDSRKSGGGVQMLVTEIIEILRRNEDESLQEASEIYQKNISEESCAAIDLMIVSLHSQPLLMSMMLQRTPQ